MFILLHMEAWLSTFMSSLIIDSFARWINQNEMFS